MQKATAFLLVFTALVSLLEVPYPGTAEALAMNPVSFAETPWILITAMIVHLDLAHLLQNMVALAIFGTFLESVIGPGRLFSVYFLSGVTGNLAALIFYPQSMSLGASGAIMGMVGALTILRPKAAIWFGTPLPVIFLSAIFIITDTAGLFVPSGIGNAAHLAGFFAGTALGHRWKRKFSLKNEVRARVRKSLKSHR